MSCEISDAAISIEYVTGLSEQSSNFAEKQAFTAKGQVSSEGEDDEDGMTKSNSGMAGINSNWVYDKDYS